VAPYLTLAIKNAPERVQRPHTVTSELRSLVQAGAQWRPRSADWPLQAVISHARARGRPEAGFPEVVVYGVPAQLRLVRSSYQNLSAAVFARRTPALGKRWRISWLAPAESGRRDSDVLATGGQEATGPPAKKAFTGHAARAQGRQLQSIALPRATRGCMPLPREPEECWPEILAGPHPQPFPTLILPRFSSSPLLRECITGSRGGYCRSFLL
jgi:hypothetical protein